MCVTSSDYLTKLRAVQKANTLPEAAGLGRRVAARAGPEPQFSPDGVTEELSPKDLHINISSIFVFRASTRRLKASGLLILC